MGGHCCWSLKPRWGGSILTNDASKSLVAIAAARTEWMTGQLGTVDAAELNQLETAEAHLRLLAMDAQFRCLSVTPPSDLQLTHAGRFHRACAVLSLG